MVRPRSAGVSATQLELWNSMNTVRGIFSQNASWVTLWSGALRLMSTDLNSLLLLKAMLYTFLTCRWCQVNSSVATITWLLVYWIYKQQIFQHGLMNERYYRVLSSSIIFSLFSLSDATSFQFSDDQRDHHSETPDTPGWFQTDVSPAAPTSLHSI